MDYIDRIQELMKENKLSGVQLGKKIGLSKSPVTDWKNGKSKPTLEQIKMMCQIFDVSADYILFGKQPQKEIDYENFAIFDILDSRGKEVIENLLAYIGANINSKGQTLNYEEIEPKYLNRDIPLYDLPVSAGNGQFLDSDIYEVITVQINPLSSKATFAVRITGDSMEPQYKNGDILFVRQQHNLNHGDLGIFVIQGEGFFKRFFINEKGLYLESLNNTYSPIHIEEYKDCRIVGKVLGKCEDEYPP